ncbi:carboxypeptidase-like regulatory domain-containing protein [uncultured Winogradskyella sp.]|uniref:carboxypeptidase-like regulatory domain-containing protein n=1 Tax=uncultured Winogradskyella sp. TaxID=395353 RepID=UPI00260A1422|nr:carboxypeptidase-like regulatory domain-containing protein [uncultured Winogradskyella sp.]
MTSRITFVLLLFSCLVTHAQTLKGKVIDVTTKEPLEMVSVYFNNTTIGTTTNAKGDFSIDYNDAVQSPLIISYLGYEKVVISDYRNLSLLNVELKEASNQLDEVVIKADDGLTRKQKLKIFRDQFLGTSKYGKTCKIINEDDLILRYDKRGKQLTVSAKAPLEIENRALKYHITYELVDFEVVFNYIDLFRNDFNVYSTFYSGSSLYKDENIKNKESILKQREKVYRGSIQHFMRSIFRGDLKKEKYKIFKRGFGVKTPEHIVVKDLDSTNFKEVKLSGKLTVTHRGKSQSDLIPKTDKFYVDEFGNFVPVQALFFNGAMGNQRIGDTLPLDYGLDNNSQNSENSSQIINEGFVEGSWQVVNIDKSPKEPPFSLMVDSFKEAKFTFNSDRTCKLETTVDKGYFSLMTSVINQSTWDIRELDNNSFISIANNQKSQMELLVTVEGEDVFFTIGKEGEPSYFVLRVVKE